MDVRNIGWVLFTAQAFSKSTDFFLRPTSTAPEMLYGRTPFFFLSSCSGVWPLQGSSYCPAMDAKATGQCVPAEPGKIDWIAQHPVFGEWIDILRNRCESIQLA